jgi:hypothetical protein
MLGKPKDNVKSNISKTNFDRQKISSYTNSEDLNIPIYSFDHNYLYLIKVE